MFIALPGCRHGVGSFADPPVLVQTGLPEGKYKLIVDSRADSAIGPHPSSRMVQCSEGAVQNVDFELK